MKNLIIAILACIVLACGYYMLSQYRLPIGNQGKLAKVTRGDLTLPINATGEVLASRRVVIKAEASGEVLEIFRQAGEFVEKGEQLMRLDKDEEQRSVDRAEQDLARAAAQLETAKILLNQRRTVDLASAQAAIDQIKASLVLTRFRAEKVKENPEPFHEEERIQRQSACDSQEAQLAGAEAKLDGVKLAIEQATQDVNQSQATYETARSNLLDAKRRLRKTSIAAPISGILAVVRTHVGEVIQGGKTTFTGGTELAVILDVEKMLVQAEIDESEIERVLAIAPDWAKPGNDTGVPVPEDLAKACEGMEFLPKISVEAYRDESFEGVIERIYPEPKVLSGVVTYLADVVVTSENRTKLFPRMRAEVEFTSEHVKDVIICPNEAIRPGPDGGLGVFVPGKSDDDPDAKHKFVACEFGLSTGTSTEVISGLSEGDSVYVKMPTVVRKND